jgi:hypothetical protein
VRTLDGQANQPVDKWLSFANCFDHGLSSNSDVWYFADDTPTIIIYDNRFLSAERSIDTACSGSKNCPDGNRFSG